MSHRGSLAHMVGAFAKRTGCQGAQSHCEFLLPGSMCGPKSNKPCMNS